MAARGSLLVRAVIALVLMVLFYATAALAVVGLAYAGLRIFAFAGDGGRGGLIVILAGGACVIAAGVIAWSVLPRVDAFEAPGPEVSSADQPALFGELRRVADATGEAMPAHVYLVDDVNAFVAQRGGLMGFGSRRVMGVGLPLMRALSVKELRAVLAHELGHFFGGDTRLGPWIYKTRGSMIRTVVNLDRAGRGGAAVHALVPIVFAVVRAPFLAFAKGYLRVSQAVSRAQEYSADGVAVRAEGSRAMIDGLKKTHAAALAHQLYLRNELAPMLERGALPPVGEGFTRFLGDERIDGLLDQAIDAELRDGAGDVYDSHPPLRERIAAAQALAGGDATDDARPAIALVDDPEQYETAPIAQRSERRLTRVSWSETGRYWVDGWRANVRRGRRELARFTVATVPRDERALRDLATTANDGMVPRASRDDLRRWAVGALGSALAVVLVDAGFAVETAPGAPFGFRRGDALVEPFVELDALLAGKTTAEEWRARFAALDLAATPLAAIS